MKNLITSLIFTLVICFMLALAVAPPAHAQMKNNEVAIEAIFVRQNPHFTRADFKYNSATDQIGAEVSLTHYFSDSAFGVTADVGASAQGRRSANHPNILLELNQQRGTTRYCSLCFSESWQMRFSKMARTCWR